MKVLIDVFDPKSIDIACDKLKQYARSIPKKIDAFLNRLTQEASDAAIKTYGGEARVTAIKKGSGYSIVARGEEICFLEFGTGIFADSSHPYASEMPFQVYPGSWSETQGKHTWSNWNDAGKDPMKYPYNRVPKPGMYEAFKYIMQNAKRIATEEFSRD